MKRDLVTLIWAEEVRERVGVFLDGEPNNNSHWLIIDAVVSNMHFLSPPRVGLTTSEGVGCVEVAMDDDDDGAIDLSEWTCI